MRFEKVLIEDPGFYFLSGIKVGIFIMYTSVPYSVPFFFRMYRSG